MLSDAAVEERVGILRVTVNRAVNVRKGDNAKQPTPVCVAATSGQKFVTQVPVDKTNKPLWDEMFLFFNVSDRDAVTLRLCDGGERGEFLGECSVAMGDVTRDMELTDMFSLEGVKNNAQIFAQFKFSYLS